jgi:hypothetical protein
MWAALEAYQPKAIADGHGDSWRVMCKERTWAATAKAYDATPIGSAAAWAALSAAAAAVDTAADRDAQEAIDALREVKP